MTVWLQTNDLGLQTNEVVFHGASDSMEWRFVFEVDKYLYKYMSINRRLSFDFCPIYYADQVRRASFGFE